MEVANDSNYDYIKTVAGVLGKPEPIVVIFLLNSTKMKLDTGAPCTLVPKGQCKSTWPIVSKWPILNSSHVTLNA